MIRSYLRNQAGAFEHGEVTIPATALKHDLPGLAKLQAGTKEIAVEFQDTDAGGRITYRTADPLLWQALTFVVGTAVKEQGVETGTNIGIPPALWFAGRNRP